MTGQDARLQMAMSQRLVMTPMLQQAIKLLQMSRIELVDLVKQEMLENPVLDEIEDNAEPSLDRQDDTVEREQDLANEQQESSVNWEEFFDDNPAGLGYYGGFTADDDNQLYENIISTTTSLVEHLTWQLQMSQLPERAMRIGLFLIGHIDDDGYIRCEGQAEYTSRDPRSTTSLEPEALSEFRSQMTTLLCQKLNTDIAREYILDHLELPGMQGILAKFLVQEYYEELVQEQHSELFKKLHSLTLKELDTIIQGITELSPVQLETLTNIPADEIETGLHHLHKVHQHVRPIIEHHCTALLENDYETKLEKLELSAEEFHLLEYLLSTLFPEELAYLASKDNPEKATKREPEIRTFLETLRQSYFHINNLQSHKYYLIQLYNVGVGVVLERFKHSSSFHHQKIVLKLLNISGDDIQEVAEHIAQLRLHCNDQSLPIAPIEVENLLHHIHTFAPPGMGARDVQECLMIQARNLGITDTAVEPIIMYCLPDLQQKRYEKIKQRLEISLEDIELAEKIISNMSPQPGEDFSQSRSEYIIPDIYVYKVDDEYEVVLNEDELPRLRINPVYKKLLVGNNHKVPDTTKQYVDQKLKSAVWFIRSVEQRKRTIYKVGKSIVKFQKEFLDHGISHLKPLILRDVADDIAMHESTVSRVTTNKYIHTPQGVFELKYFFHSGLESSSGDDVSSLAVKERIKQMIVEEESSRPLSDKTLETLLNKAGVAIARRTIAKYREELGIPSSVQRKQKRNWSNE